MKYIIIVVIFWISFALGWTIAIRYVTSNNEISRWSVNSSWVVLSWTLTPAMKQKALDEEKDNFLKFIVSAEKKYRVTWNNVSIGDFAQYLESIVRYVYSNPTLFTVMLLPYKELNENIDLINEQIRNPKTSHYGLISIMITAINSVWNTPKTFSKNECSQFLKEQKDIGAYLKDLSILSYSKYRNSPFFNRKLDDIKLDDIYNPEWLVSKTEKDTDMWLLLNRLIVSDVLFFQRANTMTLEWIADAIPCDIVDIDKRQNCLNLQKAMKTKDLDFIRKKFSQNERKYDMDSFYVLHLIGDLTKEQLTDRLCLIK
jgi:hypothetical protein